MLRQDDKDALDSFSEKLSENLPKTFSKKHPLGKLQRNAVTSPTDNLLSPATVKVEEKRRQLLSTIKPTKLQFE